VPGPLFLPERNKGLANFQIRNFRAVEQDGRSWHEAELVLGGERLQVTSQHGSWTTVPDKAGRRRDVLPFVAARLQAKLPSAERRAR
jgi:hypothetical protein